MSYFDSFILDAFGHASMERELRLIDLLIVWELFCEEMQLIVSIPCQFHCLNQKFPFITYLIFYSLISWLIYSYTLIY